LYHIAVNSESNVNNHNNMQHKTAKYFVTSYVQVKMGADKYKNIILPSAPF